MSKVDKDSMLYRTIFTAVYFLCVIVTVWLTWRYLCPRYFTFASDRLRLIPIYDVAAFWLITRTIIISLNPPRDK